MRIHSLPKGFTLIEVLVVVAIIALLIAILLPSLQRAREQTWHAICLSNLHQFGLAMQTYVAEQRYGFPRGGESQSLHWTMIVARSMHYVNALPSGFRVNDLQIDKMGVFHCPTRTRQLPRPFVDYVVNALNQEGPDSGGVWREQHFAKLSAYKRPAEVIYLLDAAREDKSQTFGDHWGIGVARKNWEDGLGRDGIDLMDVFFGGHLPEGKNGINVDEGPSARRAARKMHLNRFTNAVFLDGHAVPVPLANRGDEIENYAYWLRLFGVKDPLTVAQTDPDLH